MAKRLLYIATFVLLIMLPEIIEACPMCQGGEGFSKKSIFAYKTITLILALLPLLMGFAIFRWIYVKSKE